MLQRPPELGGGEVRVQDQPGDLAHTLFMARLAESRALAGRAAVLPDDCGRDGFERLPVPQHKGLALVGDPDRRDVRRPRARTLQRLVRARLHRGPDLVGVMLDPPRSRVVLGDLRVTLAPHTAVESHRHGGRAGGALVEAEDYFGCQVRFSRPVSYPSRSAATNL